MDFLPRSGEDPAGAFTPRWEATLGSGPLGKAGYPGDTNHLICSPEAEPAGRRHHSPDPLPVRILHRFVTHTLFSYDSNWIVACSMR